MDMFCYNQLQQNQYTDSRSPVSDSSLSNRNTFSDEEIQLASDKPKRKAGRTKFRETRHPVYRGVRQRNNDKWVCEVREPNKKTRIWLGTFATPEMAARAHDVAAMAFRGRSACLNFADSVWRLPVPVSSDPDDIRKAAVEAANAFQQSDLTDENNNSGNSENLNSMISLSPVSPMISQEKVFYMDEEAEFGMPRFYADMAEGLLLSPPPSRGFSWDDMDSNHAEVSLWSYSI
uniref:Dehydration-responsive element-binding protein 1 n=1 Tax=Papaver nudicaule TaxID=74823 RepID=A0A1B0Z6Y0_PAPNU|nr:dehydration-responsive element-binding protein 1 [Papaver nudicaule]